MRKHTLSVMYFPARARLVCKAREIQYKQKENALLKFSLRVLRAWLTDIHSCKVNLTIKYLDEIPKSANSSESYWGVPSCAVVVASCLLGFTRLRWFGLILWIKSWYGRIFGQNVIGIRYIIGNFWQGYGILRLGNPGYYDKSKVACSRLSDSCVGANRKGTRK